MTEWGVKKKKNGATVERGMFPFHISSKKKKGKKRLERRLDKLSVTVWVNLFSLLLITPDWTKLNRIRVMPFGCVYNKSNRVIKNLASVAKQRVCLLVCTVQCVHTHTQRSGCCCKSGHRF